MFTDAKRAITKELLMRIDFDSNAQRLKKNVAQGQLNFDF
jgi:hypothetical protein